jgi:hypothetical protein
MGSSVFLSILQLYYNCSITVKGVLQVFLDFLEGERSMFIETLELKDV